MKTYPTIQGDWEIGNDRGKSAIKGYFHCTHWTRFHVPSTFIRGEKYPTIQGVPRNRQRSRKIGNQRVLHCTHLDAVSRPEYFHKGWKIPYYTGWLRNRQRSRKIGKQRVLSLYSLDAVSRPEYFHKGWKIPYCTGCTEKSATIEENRQSKGTFIVLIWTRFHVPSTFIRGEKYPTIQGDWEIGNDRGKSAIKGYIHCTLWTRFHVPSTFIRGEKYPTIQGVPRNRQRSRKIGNQRVLLLYYLDALSRTEYFHKGWKIPYCTGWLRKRYRLSKIGEAQSFRKAFDDEIQAIPPFASCSPDTFAKIWPKFSERSKIELCNRRTWCRKRWH